MLAVPLAPTVVKAGVPELEEVCWHCDTMFFTLSDPYPNRKTANNAEDTSIFNSCSRAPASNLRVAGRSAIANLPISALLRSRLYQGWLYSLTLIVRDTVTGSLSPAD